MTWGELFERAASVETTETAVREALSERRARAAAPGLTTGASANDATTGDRADEETVDGDSRGGTAEDETYGRRGDDPPETAAPTRVVADADVLAADLLVGGPAREALDAVRSHSWLGLVASDPLLADARAVVETLTGDGDDGGDVAGADGGGTPDADGTSLADAWLERARAECIPVRHPAGDHPGLASAYRGGAAHLLSFDARLTGARAGLSVQPYAALSVRRPEAFAAVFDAAALYEAEVGDGDDYPGPDRDPRG